jgi:uncharacterized protein (DUF433 family)
MTATAKKLMIRVIKNRMADGETFDEIIKDYPKLTDSEVEELREAVGA